MVVLVAIPSLGAGGETPEAPPESWTQQWFFRFLVNAAGYASFMLPGYLLVRYFRRKNYLETGVWTKGGEVCSVPIESVGQLSEQGCGLEREGGREKRGGEEDSSRADWLPGRRRGLTVCVFFRQGSLLPSGQSVCVWQRAQGLR